MDDSSRNASLHLYPNQGSPPQPHVLHSGAVPPPPLRALQRVAVKVGRMDWERRWLEPLLEARATAGLSAGPPRFLVRVDEFPYATSFDEPNRYGLEASRRFHAIMADAGLPHLMAIVPEVTHAPLNPHAHQGRPLNDGELALIDRMRSDGLTFAQHGTTHRTRRRSPRRRSELVGLPPAQAAALIDRGRATLEKVGVQARIFVPPFNRFSAAHWEVLSERFDVICGGPESVALLGWQGGPLWRGDAVYMPCYAPFYATARKLLAVTERLIDRAPGTWIPLVLHLSWEADDGFGALRRLAERIASYAARWEDFLADVDRSRGPPSEPSGSAARMISGTPAHYSAEMELRPRPRGPS